MGVLTANELWEPHQRASPSKSLALQNGFSKLLLFLLWNRHMTLNREQNSYCCKIRLCKAEILFLISDGDLKTPDQDKCSILAVHSCELVTVNQNMNVTINSSNVLKILPHYFPCMLFILLQHSAAALTSSLKSAVWFRKCSGWWKCLNPSPL